MIFRLISIFTLVLACCCVPISQADDSIRISLEQKDLLWVESGIWSNEGNRLHLVDFYGRKMVPLSTDGQFFPALSFSTNSTYQFPRVIRANEGNYLLEFDDGALAELDSSFQRKSDQLLLVVDNQEGGSPNDIVFSFQPDRQPSLGALYSWDISGSNLYAFADVRQGAPEWAGAFVSIPLATPSEFSLVLDLKTSPGDPLSAFYTLGLNMIAADGEVVYILVMDSPAYIAVIESGQPDRFFYLERACPGRPLVDVKLSPQDQHQLLDSSAGPRGIFALDGRLVLLCRGGEEEDFRLSLFAVDTTSGAFDPLAFSIESPNVTVVPGQTHWAFVHKGQTSEVQMSTGVKLPYQRIDFVQLLSTKNLFKERSDKSNASRKKEAATESWIWQEREWVFSGIGVFALTLLLSFLHRWWSAGRS